MFGIKCKDFSGWINPVTNKTYQFGDVIHRHQLADTMEKLAHARDPVELFYHGEMADTIVREIQANGWWFMYFTKFVKKFKDAAI